MKILCFGDSNTYGFDPRSYFGSRYDASDRWVDLLAKTTEWEVLNAGENGREIPKHAGELERFNQLLSRCHPLDMLLIMLGGNDLLQGADVPTVVSRMRAFLTQISLEKERIVLITPPPMKRGAWVPNDHLVDDSLRLADAYRKLAGEVGIRYIGTECWNIELTFDGVHFTESGHRTFAQQITQFIYS